jgi:branched-chain amino acid aminotransferase
MSPPPADPIVWLNGQLLKESEARVSPFDHGFTVGDGVFETLVTYRGRPFALTRHWQRLARSAAGLGLPVPSQDELSAALNAVIEANQLPEARLRITVTGGRAPLGSAKGDGSATVVVAAAPKPVWPRAADVVVVPWPRNERGALAGLKTTSYAENVVALAFAQSRGCDEAVFGNTRGDLCEGTGTNIFVVTDHGLRTPPLSSGPLAGVTREIVLEIVRQAGIRVAEETMPLDVLARADEAFLTSTTREVQPIATVDGKPLPHAPGPFTARIIAAWRVLVETGNLDP